MVFKREYNDYHKLYIGFQKCATKRNAQFHQTHTEKLFAKSKLYQQSNEEELIRDRKTVNSYRNDIEMLNEKAEELTNALELLKTTISIA